MQIAPMVPEGSTDSSGFAMVAERRSQEPLVLITTCQLTGTRLLWMVSNRQTTHHRHQHITTKGRHEPNELNSRDGIGIRQKEYYSSSRNDKFMVLMSTITMSSKTERELHSLFVPCQVNQTTPCIAMPADTEPCMPSDLKMMLGLHSSA